MNDRKALKVIFFIALALVLNTNASANSCWSTTLSLVYGDKEETVYAWSDTILIGSPTEIYKEVYESVDTPPYTIYEKAKVKVEEPIKGLSSGDKYIYLEGGEEDCTCVVNFHIDKKYKIYADYNEEKNKYLMRYCKFITLE